MVTFPLKLQAMAEPQRAASAWFVPGETAAAWIEEIASWGIPMAELRLYLVPRSLVDRRPLGALVTVPPGSTPVSSPRARPYGLAGQRLYLPVEARLDPDVAAVELDLKLASGLLVLHPAAGLVGFDPNDALQVGDLLEKPAPAGATGKTARSWHQAHPGLPALPRLLSVKAEVEITLETLFSQRQEENRDLADIGSEPLAQLPPAPQEQEGSPKGMAGAPRRALARFLSWLTELVPATATEPTWIDRLRDWARAQLAALKEAVPSRAREIQRLLHLLETDPDQGLRYAPPLTGGAGSRGLAEPASELPVRHPDFDLDRLKGGGSAHPWLLSQDIYRRLLGRYREAANRELRLGRYRRAAYILAELLGDHSAAARALLEGRHYRDAAVLYRQYLKLPLEAARCLEKGGLLLEAIEIYEAEGHLEAAGDVYARLERQEEAERVYRQAAASLRERGDIIAAGRLLEKKVKAPEEALGLYAAAWPSSSQAGECLQAWFDLLGRLGRHEDGLRYLKKLREEALPPTRSLALAMVLSRAATSYPEARVRLGAADLTRVVAGRQLGEASLADAENLVDCVRRLAQGDRLLARDGGLFLDRLRDRLKKAQAEVAARLLSRRPLVRKGAVEQVLSFTLPKHVAWEAVASLGDHFCAVGFEQDRLVLVRGLWGERLQRTEWRSGQPYAVLLALNRRAIIMALAGGPPLFQRMLSSFDSLPPTPAGGACWFPSDLCGLTGFPEIWILRRRESSLVLEGTDHTGTLRRAHTLPLSGLARCYASYPMTALPQAIFVGVGSRLYWLAKELQSVELEGTISSLAGAPPYSLARIVASLEDGAAIVRLLDPVDPQYFAKDLANPRVAFTRDGSLVLVSGNAGRIYRTVGRQVVLGTEFPLPGRQSLAVVPAERTNEFAVFSLDGSVTLFRVRE